MGRREQREELQSTWSVYVPRVAGTPMTAKDVEDAAEQNVSPKLGKGPPDMLPSDAFMRGLIARGSR